MRAKRATDTEPTNPTNARTSMIGSVVASRVTAASTARPATMTEMNASIATFLADLPGVLQVDLQGGRVHLTTSNSDVTVRALVNRGVPFEHLEASPTSLDEAYRVIAAEAGR